MSAEDGSVPNARVTDAGSDSSQDSEPRAEPDSGGCRLASNAPGAPAPTALALLLFGLFMCRRRN
jgi:MYXO-CTERM domain-containing protein